MKKPTIIEIKVCAMNPEGIEKEFVFHSMQKLKEWWKDPYKQPEYHGVMNRCQDLTNEEVCKILDDLGRYTHYLKYKEISKWDKYDKSNWRAIAREHKKQKLPNFWGV